MNKATLDILLQVAEHAQPLCLTDLQEAASLLLSYFKRPLHEITIEQVRVHQPYLEFYLWHLRMPAQDQPAALSKVDSLLGYAEAVLPGDHK